MTVRSVVFHPSGLEFLTGGDDQRVIRWSVEKRRCLLYTSDAADERSSVDLGGRRIIKKKNRKLDGDDE